ncbi:MAG: ABC transporter substrate-binding protein [Bradyrhizobium sp.]|uniref:ABC transporter substrate-binding protein n=1 Tax=Bradyrhizobium sp. TaxID=376 RepID=UPI001E0E9188|nr:ABC transporter substrate-binding protein [Bradyrhizobium sp.]MBV9560690.1 ABC transporter substrate-binding protein [Bradyrhizobium sp.]
MAVLIARRRMVVVLGAATIASPAIAWAEATKLVHRVGMLSPNAEPSETENAFLQELPVYGYVVGQDLLLEYKGAAEHADRLDQLAAESVAERFELIFASGSQATRAVRRQTSSIPIVTVSSNPVGLGFVESLARPGGNITGVSILGPEVSGKRFELLKELVPAMVKVAVFTNPNDPGSKFSLTETQELAKTIGVELQILETSEPADFDKAFEAATRESASAVLLLPAPIMNSSADRIAKLALQSGLPTLFFSNDGVKVGGLASYGPNLVATYRRVAYYVDRILKGAKPSDLPVEQPTKFDLAINLKTARAIGLTVAPTLVVRADEVIE